MRGGRSKLIVGRVRVLNAGQHGAAPMLGFPGAGEGDIDFADDVGHLLRTLLVLRRGANHAGRERDVVERERDIERMRRAPLALVDGRFPVELIDPGVGLGGGVGSAAVRFDDLAAPGARVGGDGEEDVAGGVGWVPEAVVGDDPRRPEARRHRYGGRARLFQARPGACPR